MKLGIATSSQVLENERFYVVMGWGREVCGPFSIFTALKRMRSSRHDRAIVVDSMLRVIAYRFNPEKTVGLQ
jgi:hypothetical protein